MTLSNRKTPGMIAFKIARTLVLLCATFLIFVPLVVMLSSTFKPDSQLYDFPMRIIPKTPTLANFKELLDRFPRYTFNSIKLTVIIVLVQLITATTGAYAFSKLRWKGRDLVFILYVVSIMIPVQSIIIPQFLIIRGMGLYNTHWALILTGAFSAFGTFLIKQYFMTIPDSYIEAAHIDGANDFRIFVQIVIPLAKPVFATQIIFAFRYFWNDFFAPLIYITSQHLKTLPLGMSDFANEFYTYRGPQMAASFISIIPVMIIFMSAQKYFVEGVAASGVKG
ncbi:MAG: carbohydrate ABC transporter permease [Treponema sp.]|jgi:multiple sugar transport system permease protein|nr:carbohydrate ABC transporter permease [Treponema sp.]